MSKWDPAASRINAPATVGLFRKCIPVLFTCLYFPFDDELFQCHDVRQVYPVSPCSSYVLQHVAICETSSESIASRWMLSMAPEAGVEELSLKRETRLRLQWQSERASVALANPPAERERERNKFIRRWRRDEDRSSSSSARQSTTCVNQLVSEVGCVKLHLRHNKRQTVSRQGPNWVHFSLKMWHLVTIF